MQTLIPNWILAQDAQGRKYGSMEGATLFADISGFTALTGKLMSHGKEGAEILWQTLRFYFDPLVDAVDMAGGLIAGFAGDAFTAIFPIHPQRNVAAYAHQSALTMQRFFGHHAIYENVFGQFPFALKIGLSWGTVQWGIIDTNDRTATYYFRGSGIDNCALAEHHADQGMVVCDQEFHRHLPDAQYQPITEDIYLCVDSGHDKSLPLVKHTKLQLDASRFLPNGLDTFPPQGEFRHVAAVFLSFREVDDLEQLAHLMQGELDQFGGTLTRFDFGDKGCNALIFFGAPIAYENDAERALDFALSFFDKCRGLIDVRGGITRDITYAGFNGGTRRHEFTCLGRPVNLAARLMMRASWSEIWCEPQIYEQMHTRYNFQTTGIHALKGFEQPIEIHRLIAKHTERQLQFNAQAMVGREEEIEQLHLQISRIFAGEFGGLCYVDGEPGMGKSYLVDSYRQQLQTIHPAGALRWIYAPCDQTLRHSLHPFSYALRVYCRQSPSQSKEQNWLQFDMAIDQLIDQLPPHLLELQRELHRVRSFLAAMLGLRRDGSLYEQLDPKLRFENTLTAIQTWLRAESTIQPVVLQIEDGQWLDDNSIEAIKRLAQLPEHTAFAIVLTCRYLDDGTPFRIDISQTIAQTTINLNQLSARGLQQLADNQLSAPASPELLSLLADKSRGNPFFAEQILRYLQENSGLQLTHQGFAPLSTGLILPDEVNSVLVARLDRLAADFKQFVQVASVLGQQFNTQILAAIVQTQALHDTKLAEHSIKEQLLPGLELGEDEQIWTAASATLYLFRHALLRDAAYDMQVRTRLRNLHLLAGQAFEEIYREELAPYYGELAYHYERAEARNKAILYLELAGDSASKNYHNSAAIDYYTRLLALNPEDGECTRRICLSIAKVLQLLTRLDEGLDYCEQAAQALPSENPQVHYQKAILLMMKGKLQEAQDMTRHALQLSRYIGDVLWEATSLVGLGGLLLYSGELDTAWSLFEDSLALSNKIDKPELQAKALNNMAGVAAKRGHQQVALDLLKRSLELKRQIQDRWGETITLGNLGELYLDLDQAHIALDYLTEAQRNCDELGSLHPPFALHLTEAMRRLGLLAEAQSTCKTALHRAETFGNPKYIALGQLFWGHILRDLDQNQEAKIAYQQCLDIAEQRKLTNFKRDAHLAMEALELQQTIPLSFPR
jgi:class 3 adenylate cyclase/tetratricopeptide (TPR) repeat protein